ncbi:conserved oligomeric Golgi complex subunit 8 [Biomphalaria pfeifferi]|uniref:Conserved oligomeric Golgi complex subunit 8 n=1 Tax=Biomphalaria pfeifferi TaxID=112525 RepID=A0AAD8B6I9_BIOPF|nr:conserved oligomeric Golgi complex subunit 8 [Biomphalaria pfeifferi]
MELSLKFIFLTFALISNTPNVLGRQIVSTPVVCTQAGAVLYNGNCYQAFSDTALNFHEAQLACDTWGGGLATIDSDALAYAVIPNWYSLSYWIGMKLFGGTWFWVYDNSAVNLTSPELNNWADFGAIKPGYVCLSINDEGYGLYLQDKLCSSTSYYVCMGAPTSAIATTTTTTTTVKTTTLSSKSKDKSKGIPEGCNGPNNGKESNDNKRIQN